jgi:hypothetical protein
LALEIYNVEIAMKLSALAVFLMLSCTTQQPATQSQSQPAQTSAETATQSEPWSVKYESSGGISGRGMGNVTIASDGTITVRSLNGKTCTYQATANERRQVEHLVPRALGQETAAGESKERACCDMITYTMTIDRSGVQRSTTWGEDSSKLPPDVRALATAMNGLRASYVGRCSSATAER